MVGSEFNERAGALYFFVSLLEREDKRRLGIKKSKLFCTSLGLCYLCSNSNSHKELCRMEGLF